MLSSANIKGFMKITKWKHTVEIAVHGTSKQYENYSIMESAVHGTSKQYENYSIMESAVHGTSKQYEYYSISFLMPK